jgi:hypothetical protein
MAVISLEQKTLSVVSYSEDLHSDEPANSQFVVSAEAGGCRPGAGLDGLHLLS